MDLTSYIRSGVHDPAPQQSGAWHENRVGKLTASALNNMLDMRKDGQDGAKRKALRWAILAERMTNVVADNAFVTPAMQWGIDHEREAVDAYHAITGRETIACGFFDHPDIDWLGASPDRMVGSRGLLEVKCPTTQTHLQWLQSKRCPMDYAPQMTLQLACTGREWCDFASYEPRLRQESLQLKVWRFVPGEEYTDWLLTQCKSFLGEIERMFDNMGDSAA